jgi:preprotein translocase subunit SecF
VRDDELERVIEFLRFRFIALGFSLVLFALLVTGTIINGGINWGIDFVGGVKLIARFEKSVDIAKIREVLSANDIHAMVQNIGTGVKNEYIISTKLLGRGESSEKSYEILKGVLGDNFNAIEYLSVETVGPAIGDFLKREAAKLFSIALIMMLLYLSFRFEVKYAMGVIVALVHDVTLSLAFCGLLQLEIDIPVIAALLTIFGYSANDTIVVFDRIRENVQIKSKQTFREIIDRSISQSMSRTLLTSLTTLFAVFALYMLGGDVINDFAVTLLFGIFIGTYSTLYIASPVVLAWERFSSK